MPQKFKVVIAPDKFKGSLAADEAAAAIATGVRKAFPDAILDLCPMADGGEGTVAALVSATRGTLHAASVCGPLPGFRHTAAFGMLGDRTTAVVEMAAASGLALLSLDDRNPLNTTTFGTGELLLAAVKAGATEIIVGIGGSATVDAGIGCAQACGLPVLLKGGELVSPSEPLCGRDLPKVVLVKHGRGSPIERVKITVACDVTNPLFGPNGAAVVYGPQKGASPAEVRWLDDQLRNLADRLGKVHEASLPGAGAAGGLGFGMMVYFSALLRPGVEIVLQATKLSERLRDADLCITGEGRLDRSSLSGKTPVGVAALCRRIGVPCVALVGSVGEGADEVRAAGIDAFHVISTPEASEAESMANAALYLSRAAERVVRAKIFGKVMTPSGEA